jgi:sulfur oxidation c-type cytochrome SoxX
MLFIAQAFTCRHRLAVGLSLVCTLAAAQSDAAIGLQIMTDRTGGNCVVCHTLPGVQGPASDFGPALQEVGKRYSAAQLRQWVTDARVIKAETLMPPFGTTQGTLQAVRAAPILNEEQIRQVVAALRTFQ